MEDFLFLLLCCSTLINLAGLVLVMFYYHKYIIERGLNTYLTEKYINGGEHGKF